MKLGVALFILLAAGLPAAEISVEHATGAAGRTVDVPVKLQTDRADITALQFDVEYDDSVMMVTAAIGPVGAGAEKSLSASDMGKNRKRFLIFGVNQNKIKDGVIALLLIELKPDAAKGDYTLKPVDGNASNATGQPVLMQVSGGGVTIGRDSQPFKD